MGADSALSMASALANSARGYAGSAFLAAQTAISNLQHYLLTQSAPAAPSTSLPTFADVSLDPNVDDVRPTPPASLSDPDSIEPPAIGDHEFPTPITYTDPVEPVLSDVTIPEYIPGEIRTMTIDIPDIDLDIPATPAINDGGEVAGDSLRDVILNKLKSNIESGGTMLDPTVEAEIWARDKERHEQALQDAVDKLTSQWAKMGFSLPDGLLAEQITALNNEYMDKYLDRSREIAVKQAELEQAGTFKSLELGVQWEKVIMDMQNEYAKRVYETSKTTANVLIEIFKTRVEKYNLLLAQFKADVDAYKTSIEAEMANAAAYKNRIDGLRLQVEIDDARVKVYVAKLEASKIRVEKYKTEVSATVALYEAEKQKIELYKNQVEAYTSQVDAITKRYLGEVEGFKAYSQAWSSAADYEAKKNDLTVRTAIASLEAQIKEWEVQMRIDEQKNQLNLEALKAVAQAASNVAAGALSAAHSGASVTASGQFYKDETTI